jgi:hypothetical protein
MEEGRENSYAEVQAGADRNGVAAGGSGVVWG